MTAHGCARRAAPTVASRARRLIAAAALPTLLLPALAAGIADAKPRAAKKPATVRAKASTVAVPGRVEAESLSLVAAKGAVFTDGAASAKRALLLWTNASVAVPYRGSPTAVSIRVRGDQCGGAPSLRVSVGGQSLATREVANQAWSTLSISVPAAIARTAAPAGTVTVAYVNDIPGKACDRNLRIDWISVATTPVATTPVAAAPSTPVPPVTTPTAPAAPSTPATPTAPAPPSAPAAPTAPATPTAPAAPAPTPTPEPAPAPTPAPSTTPTPAPTPNPTPNPTPAPNPAPTAPTPAPTPTPSPTTKLYVDPTSAAAKQAAAWRTSRPADAALIDTIASQPQAVWLGEWSGDVGAAASSALARAAADGSRVVFAAYAIPARDCGQYSAGGLSAANYRTWIDRLAAGIGGRPALVVLEPDAVVLTDCLSAAAQAERNALLRYAVDTLGALADTKVYLDGGHAGWKSAADLAARLTQAGIAGADGFALNTSNFGTTAAQVAFGREVAAKIGGKPFVVDTSRNGNGAAAGGAWCNPAGRALGERPTMQTGAAGVDGYLWVKRPGESDGTCNGGPAAGGWWADYALGLARNAS